MRSLVRAPLVAVKRTLTVPSSRRRGWYCSAAARLQPPVDERPARTAPGLVRPYISRTRARRRGRAPLACAARSARGLFLLRRPRAWSRASRSVGRPHPSHPSPRHLLPRTAQNLAAHHPTHRRSIGVRARSRERGALVQRHLAPLADPRRRVGLRARVCYAREDGWRSRAWPSDGCCPVSSIHPPPSKLYTRRGPRSRLGALAFAFWEGAWGRPFPAARRIP